VLVLLATYYKKCIGIVGMACDAIVQNCRFGCRGKREALTTAVQIVVLWRIESSDEACR